jgi:uncharacterized protein
MENSNAIEFAGRLVRFMAMALVDHPEAVNVEPIHVPGDHPSTTLKLRVAADDLGKVLGKGGRHARAIRMTLGAYAQRSKNIFSLDIQPVEK